MSWEIAIGLLLPVPENKLHFTNFTFWQRQLHLDWHFLWGTELSNHWTEHCIWVPEFVEWNWRIFRSAAWGFCSHCLWNARLRHSYAFEENTERTSWLNSHWTSYRKNCLFIDLFNDQKKKPVMPTSFCLSLNSLLHQRIALSNKTFQELQTSCSLDNLPLNGRTCCRDLNNLTVSHVRPRVWKRKRKKTEKEEKKRTCSKIVNWKWAQMSFLSLYSFASLNSSFMCTFMTLEEPFCFAFE